LLSGSVFGESCCEHFEVPGQSLRRMPFPIQRIQTDRGLEFFAERPGVRGMHISESAVKEPRSSLPRVRGIVAVAAIATVLLAAWWVKRYVYASQFTPTILTAVEQKALDSKLAELEGNGDRRPAWTKDQRKPGNRPPLEPEPYSEKGLKREIILTEKELNALIAHNTEAAQFVAIDLSENLISMKLVVPFDEEIPILGGKTLRLNLGVVLGFEEEKPVVELKGISLGGIPLPNAWMGNLKNRNLVKEFGAEGGFWRLFSDGVAGLKVDEGRILIKLKE